MKTTLVCPNCHRRHNQVLVWPLKSMTCSHCQTDLFKNATEAFLQQGRFNQCPVCGAAHLYRRKDFDQRLGILLVVIGVTLAYFTYGLSLLAVTLIDFLLFRRTKEVGICYQCKSEFRDSLAVEDLEPFDLELFDYYRNLKA